MLAEYHAVCPTSPSSDAALPLRDDDYALLPLPDWPRADRELRAEGCRLRAALLAHEAGRLAPLVWLVEQHAAFDLEAAWRDFGVPAAAGDFSRYTQVLTALRRRFRLVRD